MTSLRPPRPLGSSSTQSSRPAGGGGGDEPFATRKSKGYKPGPLGTDDRGDAGRAEESESYLRGARTFDLQEIPKIMRRKKWIEGATLLEKWFKGAPNDDPYKGNPDTTTVKMDWVLGFDVAKGVYDRMFEDKVWLNKAAKLEIIKWLKKNKKFTKRSERFGDFTRPLLVLENNDYIQYKSVKQPKLSSLNGLSAALANFNFRVVIRGIVVPDAAANNYDVYIYDVGIFVCDPFDFNDDEGEDQDLGWWNDQNDKVQVGPHRGAMHVTNGSFRKWRQMHGRGGDFLVFSDLKVTRIQGGDRLMIYGHEIK